MDDKRLTRIEDKLDGVVDKLGSIDVTLAKQHASLEEHMRRSLANEKAVEILAESIKPLHKKSAMAEGAWKLIGIVAGTAAMIESVYLLLQHLKP